MIEWAGSGIERAEADFIPDPSSSLSIVIDHPRILAKIT
jgi:hypothetical protein